MDLVGEQRKWLEKDDKEGTKHQVKETFLFLDALASLESMLESQWVSE